MKHKQKKLALAMTLLLISTGVYSGTTAFATQQSSTDSTSTSKSSTATSSSEEALQINAVALGNALTQEQKDYTLKALGAKGETPTYTTNGSDLMSFIPDGGFTPEWAVYSSVRMETQKKGAGISVDIATPKNITKITEAQYQNAALTAGITDAKLTVASAVPIDGSGALAGVYKIVEESGGIINRDRVGVAQDEMDVLSKITEENKDKDGYSDEALNAAQEQAKKELAAKTADGKNLTQADIQKTVESALQSQGIKDVMSSDQVKELTTLMSDMKDKNIFEDFVNQLDLSKTKEQIQEKSKGLWENIKGFFSGLWDSVTGK
ncbi:hypothetical protein A5819_002190 [Enterococcus sp. 7E2_DIV0204]|uniref:DUF1002 domain-containing protein n=1 Tax=unclassified Enterococcus TaxID=2608891 RepID=UPI000A352F96|nr:MULTISPECIES: DUF1002 domain-containing protein [unclassified Enterococcus]OTN89692.1 hypothetical protein A5819_002190 [Enterococcus sp. 7E2_DIV0204]OTP52150.1 hypothetical protein A5884_001351 [Enterococcus sp. 7D2_DIV0200]